MIAGVLILLSLTSLAAGVVLTARGTPWAFFSSPTRAWEFGAGATSLLAVRHLGVRTAVRNTLLVVGLTAIAVAALTFDEFTPYPGAAALVPVLATGFVLVGGSGAPTRAAWLLDNPVLRWLGRVSYAWYLVHWPAIVLTAAYFGTQRVSAFAAAAIASLGIAHVLTGFVERPFRASQRLRSNGGLLAGLTVVLIIGACSAWFIRERASDLASGGYLSELTAARGARNEGGSEECIDRVIGGLTACVYGDPDAEEVVVVAGDSHAGQWAPAFERVATERRFALIIRARGGCPATDVAVARTGDDEVSDACLEFRSETRELIAAADPEVVVIAQADYTKRTLVDGEFVPASRALEAAHTAAESFARDVVQPTGARLLVVENNPTQHRDPIECLARFRSSTKCSIDSATALEKVTRLSDAETSGFRAVMPIEVLVVGPMICDGERCNVESNGVINYADADHLSLPFVVSHVADVQDFLAN